ncbi:hypothetical protein [Methylorubrum extorquens]|uniref:Uncharacterized protein n=1 Tax=Methylorubrum extorquens (strain CM4 / NCIMB 13688) TaxID=440085 RepID=B7KTH3_METC4|nr:hypothetical protein [Methylorubrum extorquens]ACK82500.1 hypothetical protein Mchl_1636 [Methylorubrum extorquens CM4]
MLNPSDLASTDWDGLSAGLLALADRRAIASHQGRRMLEQKVVTPSADEHRIGEHDFPAVEAELQEIDRESALLAQTARAFAQIGRFMADDQSGRPAAAAPETDARSPAAFRLLARALTALTGAPRRNGGAA